MAHKPQLFLHIGHPKTASSTLQTFLFQNWQAIEAAGFVMPTADFALANTEIPPGNTLWSLQKQRETQDISPLLNWVDFCASQLPEKKLILSSECLMQPEWPALFQTVAKHTDIHLIYYVRRQDQLLLSAWRQWGLKRGLSLDAFLSRRLKNKQPNFVDIASAWSNNMEIASHHIRFIQPPFLTGGNVINDLCKFLGLPAQGYSEVENQNISIDARLALFLNKHADLFSSVHDEEIFTLLRGQDTREPEVRLQFNTEQFREIQQVFEPLNQQLLKKYQPNLHGIPVIDFRSANLGNLQATADPALQLEYITEKLKALRSQNHPKLIQLRQILKNTYGVTDV